MNKSREQAKKIPAFVACKPAGMCNYMEQV